eukprot:TRINITY_DN10157_c0_g1_i1.p1 TRINITY_DN10157_c0_g1~~TRINITY_DN10157_c0_g1_i1.p1  ORF type:complete len:444 (+),score=86.97 TRINITY_DN10157_c0_g1_i1:44-1375(+)
MDTSLKSIGDDIRRKHTLLLDTCHKMTNENESLKSQLKLFKMLHNVQAAYSSLQSEVEDYKHQNEEQNRLLEKSTTSLREAQQRNLELATLIHDLESKIAGLERHIANELNSNSRKIMEQRIVSMEDEMDHLRKSNGQLTKQIEVAEAESMQTSSLLATLSTTFKDYHETVISYCNDNKAYNSYSWSWDDHVIVNIMDTQSSKPLQQPVVNLAQECHTLLSSMNSIVKSHTSLKSQIESKRTAEFGCQVNTLHDEMTDLRGTIDTLRSAKSGIEFQLNQSKQIGSALRQELDIMTLNLQAKVDRIQVLEAELLKVLDNKKPIDKSRGAGHPFFEEYIELKREVAILRQQTPEVVPKSMSAPPLQAPQSRTRSSAEITDVGSEEIYPVGRLRVGWSELGPRPVSQGSEKTRLKTPPSTTKSYSISRFSVQPVSSALPTLPQARK